MTYLFILFQKYNSPQNNYKNTTAQFFAIWNPKIWCIIGILQLITFKKFNKNNLELLSDLLVLSNFI
jgi:hypothetical protein